MALINGSVATIPRSFKTNLRITSCRTSAQGIGVLFGSGDAQRNWWLRRNIAFNLKLLGGDPLPMATVGKDFGPHGDWMDKLGINRRHVTVIENEFTAQCFITTDLDDNQIAAFHPGAMGVAHVNDVGDAEGADIAIVSPDAPRACSTMRRSAATTTFHSSSTQVSNFPC